MDGENISFDASLVIYINSTNKKVKVWESGDRPGVAQRVPGGLGSQISDIWYMKVVRLSASRTSHLLPPGNVPGTHFH